MNKRHYEHTLPNIRGSLSNTYFLSGFGCMPGIGEECAGRRSANMRPPAAGERKEKS